MGAIFDREFLANPERLALEASADVLEPPPPVDMLAFAEDNIRFGAESPFPGPYDRTKFPFFNFLLELLGPEHPARVITFRKSAQVGGTVVAMIFLAAMLVLDPCPFLYVHPSEVNAKSWAQTKWRALQRQVARLRALFPETTAQQGANSTLYQERIDGMGSLTVRGANSAAGLSMLSMPRQVQDDLSKWEANSEGDPESQADSRTMAFALGKIFKISTPVIEDSCKITSNFLAGTQHHYHVPCPHCRQLQPLLWEHFVVVEEDAAASHFKCQGCGEEIHERHREWMIDPANGAAWVAHNPSAAKLGLYSLQIWTAYAPQVSWADIALRYVRSLGDPLAEKIFWNDWLGLPYRGAGAPPAWEEVRDTHEAVAAVTGHRRRQIPVGGLIFTIGVDCQGDRVEWHAKAYGRDLKRWTVDYGVIPGHISEKDTRKALDELLLTTWPDSFGNRRPVQRLAIDGNHWTDDVADWVRKHPESRVIMVRGANSDGAPLLARVKRERKRDGTPAKYSRRFFNIGTSAMKMALYQFLAVTDAEARGYYGIPAGMGDAFFEQLCSERRVPRNKKEKIPTSGFKWEVIEGRRNEVLDTANYAEAAAIREGFRTNSDATWDRLAAELEVEPPGGAQGDLEDLLSQPMTPAAAVPGEAAAAPKPVSDAAKPAKPAVPAKPGEQRFRGQSGSVRTTKFRNT